MALLINLPLRFLESHMPFFGNIQHFQASPFDCLSLSVLIVLAVITVLMLVIIPQVVAAVEALISAAQSD